MKQKLESKNNWFESIGKWLINNSLWLAGIGLFIASSGIDGAYFVKLNDWGMFGGYALNTTSDVVGMIIMYWFGIFLQSENKRKRVLSYGLLVSEFITVSYSWLFSWRQLRPLMKIVENDPIGWINEVEWLSFIFAGFVPLLLAFIGYAQGLQVSDNQKATDEKSTVDKESVITKLLSVVETIQLQLSNVESLVNKNDKTLQCLDSTVKTVDKKFSHLKDRVYHLELPPADLRWFKALDHINGSYDNLSAISKVKAICIDNGKNFGLSEQTAYRWLRELE